MSTTSCFIKFFDYFGTEFNLKTQGVSTFRTFFGFIMGVIATLCILTLSIYFFIDMIIKRNGMTVIYSQDETIIPQNNLTNVPILFTVSDNIGKKVSSNGIYNFEVLYLQYFNTKDEKNQSVLTMNLTKIPFKTCEQSDFSNYEEQFKKVNPADWNCLQPGKTNIVLNSKYGDVVNGFSILQLFLNKCKNTTSNNTCQDDAKINSILSSSRMVLSHISSQINHYNYVTPKELKLETTSVSVSTSLTKRYTYYLQQNDYETDYGQVFQNRKINNFFKFDQYFLDVEFGELKSVTGKPYIGQISIRNSNYVSYYFRSYTKFQSFLANIGGIIKFIMLFTGYFVSFVTNNLVYQNISNSIFKFDEGSENSAINIIPQQANIFKQRQMVNNIRQTGRIR